MTAVQATQRFTRQRPCAVCGGGNDDPHGRGVRCYGFLSIDGDYAHCTREEYAGMLTPYTDGTFVHKLTGDCACGVRHGSRPGVTPAGRTIPRSVVEEARYDARDPDGSLVAIKLRREYADGDKSFLWQQPSGVFGLNGRSSVAMPLYGIESIHQSHEVILTEGEKARLALAGLELPAVGTMTGAASIPNDDVLASIADRECVYLWPDNDQDGAQHMDLIAARLVSLGACNVRLVRWGGAPPKGDAADFVEAGGTAEGIRQLLARAERWTKAANQFEDCQDCQTQKDGSLPQSSSATARVTRLSSIEAEDVRWLWQGRIPLGKMTVVDGDPDLFKTGMLLDICARVTTGRSMPDGTMSDLDAPESVMFLSAEDGLGDTIRPRVDAAGADPELIITVTLPDGDSERLPIIPDDLGTIEAIADAHGVVLIVFDPLMAFLSGTVNSYRDQDVRRALAKLKTVAENTGAAVVVIRHLNKGDGSNALYRGGGSIGIIGAARSGLIVAADPDDESRERRILAMQKHNLSAPVPALAYHVETTPAGVPFVVWDGATKHTASSILTQPDSDEERSAVDDAMEVLREVLRHGPKAAADVKADAKAAGVAERTLYRAKAKLRITSKKDGFTSGWLWHLPAKDVTTDQDSQSEVSGNVGSLRQRWQSSQVSACPRCDSGDVRSDVSGTLTCMSCFTNESDRSYT